MVCQHHRYGVWYHTLNKHVVVWNMSNKMLGDMDLIYLETELSGNMDPSDTERTYNIRKQQIRFIESVHDN